MLQWFGGPTALAVPVPIVILAMFLLAGGGVGALGVAIERFAYRPLRDAPRIAPLITALGVSFLLENTMLLLFGASYRDYNTSAFIPFSTEIHIGGVNIWIVQIMVIVLSVALMFGLQLLVNRTQLGRQMRAVAADREAAEMLGINVDYTISATFFLGSALAGIAGVMAGLAFNEIYTLMGFIIGLKAFTAAVVGGIGSIPGRDARRLPDRDRRVVHHRLHLLDVHEPDRVRDPDRVHDRAPDAACSAACSCRRSNTRDGGRAQGFTRRSASTSGWLARPSAASTCPAGAATRSARSSGSDGGRAWRWPRRSGVFIPLVIGLEPVPDSRSGSTRCCWPSSRSG